MTHVHCTRLARLHDLFFNMMGIGLGNGTMQRTRPARLHVSMMGIGLGNGTMQRTEHLTWLHYVSVYYYR